MKTKTKIIIGTVLLIGVVAGVIMYMKKKKINDSFSTLDENVEKGSSTPTPQSTLLKKGSKGKAVQDLNSKLFKLGFNVSMMDENFTASTDAAVRTFQKQQGLAVDGIAGPNTMAALNSKVK